MFANSDEYTYPILEKIFLHYSSKKDGSLENVYLLACQHILEPQKKIFELISEYGIPKKNIFILGKAYSTNIDVLYEIRQEGFHVASFLFKPEEPFDKQHKENCELSFNEFIEFVPQGARVIILDDGGQLLEVANQNFPRIPEGCKVFGIEQTSSGFNRLKDTDLRFPIINVARSSTKLIKETPFIVKHALGRIKESLDKYSMAEPRILVVGLGPIGEGMKSLFEQSGYFVTAYDIAHHVDADIFDLIKVNKIDVIVGATGSRILNEEQLIRLESEEFNQTKFYLISVSSSDREFPATYLRMGATDLALHADSAYKNLVLINGGFPVTFKGKRYEASPAEMEKTMALLYGSVLYFCVESPKELGFIDVPHDIVELIEVEG